MDHATRLRNSFLETLLGLEYAMDLQADIFSRACVEAYESSLDGVLGYRFTQIFEPDVLREAALLCGLSYDAVNSLGHRPTATLRRLGDLSADHAALNVPELVNLACTLTSISRFDAAAAALEAAARRETDPRERFEIAWCEFLISNRRDAGRTSPQAFAAMRAEVETGRIPPGRVLDMCTQAVVWHLKRRELSQEDFAWSVEHGRRLVARHGVADAGAVSSWYRGLAMLPAAKGSGALTRRYMELADEFAGRQTAQAPHAYALNSVKTYLESTLKEHMYVTRDPDAAEAAGRRLIELDPVWAPSYAELGEVFERFGRMEPAAQMFETAAETGPPYVGLHLVRAARCRTRIGDFNTAVAHYRSILEISRDSMVARDEGRNAAANASPTARADFEETIAEAAREDASVPSRRAGI